MIEITLLVSLLLNLIFAVFIVMHFFKEKEKIYKAKAYELEKLKRDSYIFRERVNLFNQWLEKRNMNKTISGYLKEKGIQNVGIYGLGTIGERLLEELLADNVIQVTYIVDKKWVLQGGRYEGIPVISLDLIKKHPEVKSIIVTPVFDLYTIRSEILKIDPQIEIIGTDEIIARM